ncbi:MAG: mdtE 1 [Mucilaginibacter sp.]|nr:mdtE 1 [Mucilaginibacter sp.]
MYPSTIMNILKHKPTTAIAVLAVSVSLLLGACHSEEKGTEEAKQQKEQQDAVDFPSVNVGSVEKGKLSPSIAVPGELLPYQQVDLYAKLNSYVKTLMVDIGSQVHTGQLLVTLEAPEINSQLTAAQSRIKQQEAVYIASKATYDRLLSTSQIPGTVSQNDLEQADAKRKSDFSNLEAVKSAYKEVSSNLAYLQIRAPFNGVITTRNINLGAYVGPGGKSSDPLFVLQDQNRLRLVVSVPEAYVGGLTNKSEVKFTVRELPGEKFTAKIARLAGALDDKLRSERVEMDVYNKGNKLLPHMYADVNVPLPSHDSTLIVPKSAVVSSTEKVFVVRVTNHHAEWVDVKKGFQSGDKMEVYGNLKAGDKVVKNATDEIRDGQQLKDN